MARSRYEARIRKVFADGRNDVAIDFDGVPFSWADVSAIAAAIEGAIAEAGLGETEKVGLLGRNLPTHFSALWAVFISGRCISMIHAFQPPDALAEDIAGNRWPLVFGEPGDWAPAVIAAADAAGTVGYAFTDDITEPLVRVTKAARPGPQADRSESDIAMQLLSSGTTGKPKRIALTRATVDEMMDTTIAQYELAGPVAHTTQILPWPLSSQGGINGSLPAVAVGRQIAIQERFDAPRTLEMIRRYRPTVLGFPPAAVGMLMQLDPSRDDLGSVRMCISGSAAIDPAVRRRLRDDHSIPIAEFYGATEFGGVVTGWVAEDMALLEDKDGSVGRAMPGITIRIISPETGAPLPTGSSGLVEARVPRIGPDFVRTNDMGHMDEDGFLYIEGRADDAILRGGFKVLPEEIVELLRTHPKVGDAAIVGLADPRVGMVPAAVVEPRAGVPKPTAEELDAFLRTRLVAYKVPARFAIVDAIPRTGSMKPRREGLRALFEAALTSA